MVEGRVNFHSKGSVKDNMQRPFGVIPGAVSLIFVFNYYFWRLCRLLCFKIVMLITCSLKGTLTQTRTKLDNVTPIGPLFRISSPTYPYSGLDQGSFRTNKHNQ